MGLAAIAIALSTTRAVADPVTVRFCGWYDVSFEDVAELQPHLDDDYLRDNAPKPARGAQIVARETSFPYAPTAVFVDDAHPELACSQGVVLDDDKTYDLMLFAHARVGGNVLRVRTCDGDPSDADDVECETPNRTYVHVEPEPWRPTSGLKHITTAPGPEWNIAAAAGFAMYRRDGCLQGERFTLFTEVCHWDIDSSCQVGQSVYIGPAAAHRKYVIAHELGHAVAEAGNQWRDELGMASDSRPPCQSGIIESDYSSVAAIEGVAWYYAAVAFNNTTHDDCEIYRPDDYDGSGAIEGSRNELTPSCRGDPQWRLYPFAQSFETWPDRGYLHAMCEETHDDRGTALDWMRAFWEADADRGFDTCDVLRMWDLADPDGWSPAGGGVDAPRDRLEAAAEAMGLGEAWREVAGRHGI